MIAEKLFFLQIISDHIQKRKTIIPHELDWKLIVKYAQEHKVEGIVYYQCNDYLLNDPKLEEIYKSLQTGYYNCGYRYARVENAIEELKRKLCEEQIPYFFVKGTTISKLYPIPALRTMCDIDVVLVNDNDREKANAVLNQIGFITKKGAFEWILNRKDIEVELHDHLVYGDDEIKSERGFFFHTFREHVKRNVNGHYELVEDYNFIYLIEHLRKHFTSHGVGFRQFIDIAVICLAYGSKLNWTWIEEKCREIQLWDFLTHVLSFCHEWWKVEFDVPFQLPEHSEDFWEEATNAIFQNGVFGFQNEQHMENAIRSIHHPEKAPSACRAFILMINLICRPYAEMIRYPYCSFLKKSKILLPIAWLYRVIIVFRSKTYKMRYVFKNIYKAIDNEEHYTSYKRKWGL